jgi:hypothetical protein
VELVDALDSKSSTGNCVWVRFPPSAQIKAKQFRLFGFFYWTKPLDLIHLEWDIQFKNGTTV